MKHVTYMFIQKDGYAGSATSYSREQFVEHINSINDVIYAYEVLTNYDNEYYYWEPFTKELVTTERWV